MPQRNYLLLQGPQGPFFSILGKELLVLGHEVTKVNFNGGDYVFCSGIPAVNFRGSPAAWPAFLNGLIDERGITDIALYGDCRPLHRQAIKIARSRNLRIHVFEEGYIRPHWVTLERNGVNAFSPLPTNPNWYTKKNHRTARDPGPKPVGSTLNHLVLYCILYHLSIALLWPMFPRYRTHRNQSLLRDILGWASRLSGMPQERHRTRKSIELLQARKPPFFLFALQLNSDAQIRYHSDFASMLKAVDHVLESFSSHCPSESWLVIKNHPLHDGAINYRRYIRKRAENLGVGQRVVYLDGGHLPSLVKASKGVIVVNSTVGISSLHHKKPIIALGRALYDMPGLTHQAGLPLFWTKPCAPSTRLYSLFRKAVLAHSQVNGSFYTPMGREIALTACVRRLLTDQAPYTEEQKTTLAASDKKKARPPFALPLSTTTNVLDSNLKA